MKKTPPEPLPDAPESIEVILRRQLACLNPLQLELIDNSAQHVGHAGAQGGGGHYSLRLVSASFSGKTLLARHRLVHSALDELMRCRIHALSIQLLAPEEMP